MSYQIKSIYNFLRLLFLTGFFIGYIPVMPGTFGSLVGLLIVFITIKNKILYLSVFASLLFLNLLFAKWSENYFNVKDPRQVVLDEILGYMIIFLYLPRYNFKIFILGFIIFRLFDILKPFPIKKVENLKSSVAILLDDLIAGILTNLVLQVILYFHHKFQLYLL